MKSLKFHRGKKVVIEFNAVDSALIQKAKTEMSKLAHRDLTDADIVRTCVNESLSEIYRDELEDLSRSLKEKD